MAREREQTRILREAEHVVNVAELGGELLEAVHQAWQRERRISTHHDRGVRSAA